MILRHDHDAFNWRPRQPGPQPFTGGITPGYLHHDDKRTVTLRRFLELLERVEDLERELFGRARA
jgi:hypothetical protein